MTEVEIKEIEKRVQKASRTPWKAYIEGRDHESGSSFIMVGDGKIRKKILNYMVQSLRITIS